MCSDSSVALFNLLFFRPVWYFSDPSAVFQSFRCFSDPSAVFPNPSAIFSRYVCMLFFRPVNRGPCLWYRTDIIGVENIPLFPKASFGITTPRRRKTRWWRTQLDDDAQNSMMTHKTRWGRTKLDEDAQNSMMTHTTRWWQTKLDEIKKPITCVTGTVLPVSTGNWHLNLISISAWLSQNDWNISFHLGSPRQRRHIRLGVGKRGFPGRQLRLRRVHRKYIHAFHKQRIAAFQVSVVRREVCLHHGHYILKRQILGPENRESSIFQQFLYCMHSNYSYNFIDSCVVK